MGICDGERVEGQKGENSKDKDGDECMQSPGPEEGLRRKTSAALDAFGWPVQICSMRLSTR